MKIFSFLVILCSFILVGCGSSSAEDGTVNSDISKPGEKMPDGLQQSEGAGGGGPAKPAEAQTGA